MSSALWDTLTYAGDSLDKLGARPLRGVLGGKPREALSFIPFSDRMGITNPNDIVHGRNLTDQVGLTSKGSDSFGSHLTGMAADLLLDPLSLAGGYGAIKGARGVAKGLSEARKTAANTSLLSHLQGSFKDLIPGGFRGVVPRVKGALHNNPESLSSTLNKKLTAEAVQRDAGKIATGAIEETADHLGTHFLGNKMSKIDPAEYAQNTADIKSYLVPPALASSDDPIRDAVAFSNDLGYGKTAATQYTGNTYRNVNHYFRNSGSNWTERRVSAAREAAALRMENPADYTRLIGAGMDIPETHVAGLMGLLDHSKLPHEMTLHRGISHKTAAKRIPEMLGVPLDSPEAMGKEFMEPGFMSTSLDPRSAESFGNVDPGYPKSQQGAVLHFPNVPAGKTGAYINAPEKEVIFPPGRRVRILDNSKYPHITAELLSLLAALGGGGAAGLRALNPKTLSGLTESLQHQQNGA